MLKNESIQSCSKIQSFAKTQKNIKIKSSERFFKEIDLKIEKKV